MDILFETLSFAAKAGILAVLVILTVVIIVSLTRRNRRGGSHLEVTHLNRRLRRLGDELAAAVEDRKAFRAKMKTRKAEEKKQNESTKPKAYVLDFRGDLLATQVASLREEITAITSLAEPPKEVIVRLESGGGSVAHYGLAAAQLSRLRERNIPVTACIDRVAASGGYMMACVANTIVAAPFSIIGSIGVVAQVPNVHRFLKKHDIDVEEMTAGEFKRTVTVMGEITPKGRQKFQEQLEETHALFKDFVKGQRPKLDVNAVSSGEYWLGTRALELGLVDRLSTSDEYLLERAKTAEVYQLQFRGARAWRERLGAVAEGLVERSVNAVLGRMRSLELP